jgi:carboxyl-terminal processing protease
MLDEKIGYLRILEFVDDVHLDVQRALNRLISKGAQGILLDLRQNGGGLVDEAIQVASFFLTRGLVATEEGRGAPVSLLVQPAEPRFTGPLVVLVNKYTASASEIVAGALQDVGVSLVGDHTYGKGTIQTIFPLQADWGLRLTTARYRTRGGRPIDGIGLNPDVLIGTPAQLIQSPRDTQLSTARFLILRRIAVGGR